MNSAPVPDPIKCEACGDTVTPIIEDYIFEECGYELVVRNCEVHRCPCGREVANFSPMEVQRDLALHLLGQEDKLTAEQAKFLFEHIIFRTEGFPYMKFIAKA